MYLLYSHKLLVQYLTTQDVAAFQKSTVCVYCIYNRFVNNNKIMAQNTELLQTYSKEKNLSEFRRTVSQ